MIKKFFYVFFLVLVSLVCLVACGEEQTKEPKAEIELLLVTEMNVGEEKDALVNVLNANESDIVWTVENPAVLKIENGKVIALAGGTTKVTAKIGDVESSITITVKLVDVKIEFELNGGSCEVALPESRDGSTPIELPTPTKVGYDFEGWFEKADFSGSKVIKLDNTNLAITKLYAKWAEMSYKVTYHFTNAAGKTTTEDFTAKFTDEITLKTPTYESYNVFSGWFLEEEYIHEVSGFAANTVNQKEINLYGKEVSKGATFKVQFDLTGGSKVYEDKAAITSEFLKDYGEFTKKVYKTASQLGTGTTSPVNYHTFFAYTLSDGTKVSDKWGWLAEYLYDVSKVRLVPKNYCVLGLEKLLSGSYDDIKDEYKQGISMAFRAFFIETQIGKDDGKNFASSYGLSADFSAPVLANGFWDYLGKSESYEETVGCYNSELPVLLKENVEFDGWYRDAELTEGPVKNVFSDCTLYAKFKEAKPVTEITVDNIPDGVLRFNTLQLAWTIKEADADVQIVKFSSSDPTVASIDDKGLITAIKNGKTTIKVESLSQSGASAEFELEVYASNYFDVSYETKSWVTVGETIKLNAVLKTRTADISKMTWKSLDETIATVDKEGNVTGVAPGYVKIRALASGTSNNFDFGVTVLSKDASEVVKFVADANSDNIFTRYKLVIGDGDSAPDYYRDIYGSISEILYNRPLVIDRSYEAAAAADTEHSAPKDELGNQFITVHYTGNMSSGATAKANANYMCQKSSAVSIHYVTGNDGVYHCVDDSRVAWHAGDGTTVQFSWTKTGVKYKEGDPEFPVWGVSSNSKFTLNGQETTIEVPEGPYPENKKVTGDTFVYNGVEQPCINNLGLPFRVVNGEYEMGTTYWCTTQVKAGRICSHGGNRNSIGIESAVNPESDLWLTWQATAQLCGLLMKQQNLDITRVVGHHFFSAKNCPQPMLENDLEIWYQFRELVRTENKLITTFADYELSMELESAYKNVNTFGRVTGQVGNNPQLITYTVTIKNTTTQQTETVKLSSILESKFERDI